MIPSTEFIHNGHHVEIVSPDREHLIGSFWPIKVDGILQPNVYSSFRAGYGRSAQLIDKERTDY